MIGKHMTLRDLRAEGWRRIGRSTLYLIFEKGEQRIYWNPEANCVEHEQRAEEEKPENKKDIAEQETNKKNIPMWVV